MKRSPESQVGKRPPTARAPGRDDSKPPVRSTKRLLKVEGQVARLRLRPDRSHGAKMLYRCAVVVGLGTALAALWADHELWWFELVALIFLALGALFGWSAGETQLNFARKLVLPGKGHTSAGGIPFANLVGIVATARTVLVRTQQSSHEARHFAFGLLVADAAAPVRETLAAMRLGRVALVREGHRLATQEIGPRLEGELQAHVLPLVDCTDEIAVWQASEWLAMKLDLPLIDACNSPAVLRVPDELNLSLGERLARGLQSLDDTVAGKSAYNAASPAGATAQWQRGMCALTWRENRWFDVLMTVGMALLFPLLGFSLFRDDNAGFWICTVFGLCLLPLSLYATQWHGTNQLTVDQEWVIVRRGPFGKRLPPLATDAVEAVRIGGTRAYPLLSLVSDQRVLSIRMAPPVARWAKQHVERHMLTVYERSKLVDTSA